MSATREMIYERMSLLEEEIARAERVGSPTIVLRNELEQLKKQLEVANRTLTEGKTILKG